MKKLPVIQPRGDNHNYCAGKHPITSQPPRPLRSAYINCLKWHHAVIQPAFFTRPYVMSIFKDASDEKHGFPCLECKLYSTGSFFHLAYLHCCFFGGRNFTHAPFPSHSNRPPTGCPATTTKTIHPSSPWTVFGHVTEF